MDTPDSEGEAPRRTGRPPPTIALGRGTVLLDTTSQIDTPERVRFRHRIAGPGRRSAAWGLDALVQASGLALALAFASVFGLFGLGGVADGTFLVVLFFVQWFYGAVFETAMAGRTPGKWAMKLRVVTDSGAPATLPRFVIRNLLKGADFLPVLYGVGVLVMTLDPRLRRLGDLVAGTMVVDERPGAVLGSVPIEPPIRDDERQALPARVELGRDELAAIEELIRRRKRLGPERVEELAEDLGRVLAESPGVIAPTWERTLTLAYARATGRDRALGGDAP
jgi:uncharacterized RDD family membrane protein YckC